MRDLSKLDPKDWFGKELAGVLANLSADYQRLSDELARLSADVSTIGDPMGLNRVTATGITTDALNSIARETPNPARLVKAAADYERNVGGLEVEQ